MDTISDRVKKLAPAVLEEFAQKFIKEYTQNAFGSLSARETEILVFGLFQKMGLLSEADSLYKISRLLRISSTKARTLQLQSKLRDTSFDDQKVLETLIASLKKAALRQENTLILLPIEDPLIREDLIDKFKEQGYTPDFSRNKEILKVSVEAFAQLTDKLLDPADKAQVLSKIESNKDLKEFAGNTFKETMVHIISALAVKGMTILYKVLVR